MILAWLAVPGLLLALAYAVLLWACRRAWLAQPVWEPDEAARPSVGVSVLVAARNEAAHLPELLASLLAQRYPPLEVWVVDDHSEDDTAAVVRAFQAEHPSFPLHLLLLPVGEQGKKAALEAAVAVARGPLLCCTDADCLVPPDWTRLVALAHERTGAVLIAGPVVFHRDRAPFERFQTLDFLGMVGLSAVGLHRRWWRMANGANLSYTREAFLSVGGFEGHRHLASGDDMFLAQRLAHHRPDGLLFLKNARAAVHTAPESRLGDFVRQRLRWGGKSRHFPEHSLVAALGLVWLLCASMLLHAALTLFFAFVHPPLAAVFGGALTAQIALKAWADYRYLAPLAHFFGRADLVRPLSFAYSSAAHWLYITTVGTLAALNTPYRWKGREF